MRKFLFSAPLAVALLALTILTAPGIPSSVAGWGSVFRWVDHEPGRWLLPVAGWAGLILLITALTWPAKYRPRLVCTPPNKYGTGGETFPGQVRADIG